MVHSNLEAALTQDMDLVLVRIPNQTSHTVLIGHLTRIKAPIQTQEIQISKEIIPSR